ncbi:hypothetical protein T484DRAFT_1752355 [Baffinella frigidus]|nr:hypothetical protein T484DRAFT_1752355 [Cryptophyta sp. CCMP2293]
MRHAVLAHINESGPSPCRSLLQEIPSHLSFVVEQHERELLHAQLVRIHRRQQPPIDAMIPDECSLPLPLPELIRHHSRVPQPASRSSSLLVKRAPKRVQRTPGESSGTREPPSETNKHREKSKRPDPRLASHQTRKIAMARSDGQVMSRTNR